LTTPEATATLALSPLVASQGVRLVHHAALGSTNDAAQAEAKAGTNVPVWHVADEQLQGRGRRESKGWSSPKGNLYASLFLPRPAVPERLPQLSFVAALALDDALAQIEPSLFDHIRLKWPNDPLLDGRKIAGILTEGVSGGGGAIHAVIGIGVNITTFPENTAYGATSLQASGIATDRDAVFAALSGSMVRALAVWNGGQGFDAIRAGWLSRAAFLGQPVVVTSAGASTEGLFAGIDEMGHMVLDTPDGRHTFVAAEVSLKAL
jgi:BirA family biotin operon repressor/biotin-[acetyl-CoA-carboxylase] ligase